ncbi:hypothetical protein N9A94_01195 [Akkermansiaceae bacterium]|nr:hypothetical protein [Akkermansiaceae bacterium]MDB4537064.1 hypothetical protein [Akkermansiaceae bacterium]
MTAFRPRVRSELVTQITGTFRMIDQCNIQVSQDRVQIKPELIAHDRENLLLDNWLPLLRTRVGQDAKHSISEETLRRFYSHFDIFSDNALRVHTRSAPGTKPNQSIQFVYRIEVNLRKVIHGSNGVPIRNSTELHAALLIIKHAMSHLLVTPSESEKLIPGISENSESYWSQIEIALDVTDPGHSIRRQMRTMETSKITKEAIPYPHMTVLNGTNLELKAYDKIEHMKKRFGTKPNKILTSADEITRLEVKLKNAKMLNKDLQDIEHSLRISSFGSKKHLIGFAWNDLKSIHRTYFANLKGVYHCAAEKGSGSISGQAAVLAFLATEHEIPLGRIRYAIENYGGRTTKDLKGASREVEIKMLEFIEQQSTLTAEEILSDKAYQYPPIIPISDLEGAKFYFEHYGKEEIYQDVSKIRTSYSDPKKPDRFIPKTTEWWR